MPFGSMLGGSLNDAVVSIATSDSIIDLVNGIKNIESNLFLFMATNL